MLMRTVPVQGIDRADEFGTAMTSAPVDGDFTVVRGLRGYVTAVASAIGVGWESCALDLDTPISAYIALDWRLNDFPDRDLALLWDERHGWAVAVETHSGEDLIVLAYLGTDVVVEPTVVVRFLERFRADRRSSGPADPLALRAAGAHGELAERLAGFAPQVIA